MLRNKICRNRNGRRPCAFFSAERTEIAVTRIVTIIKSITAREIFLSYTRIKKEILWSGALWTSGYYANTVGLYASKETIIRYIQNQGREKKKYRQIYENQPELDFGL